MALNGTEFDKKCNLEVWKHTVLSLKYLTGVQYWVTPETHTLRRFNIAFSLYLAVNNFYLMKFFNEKIITFK